MRSGARGRPEEGLAAIEEALARCERNDERWYFAELLRITRRDPVAQGEDRTPQQKAEQCFLEALDWSQRQQTAAWQLRAAISLAKLYRSRTPRCGGARVFWPGLRASPKASTPRI